jgi:hypothetical protein
MTRIYYDTEFIEDGTTIELVSIGMVREDGLAYYAVSNDLGMLNRVAVHPWLAANVLPHLPVVYSEHKFAPSWDTEHPEFDAVRPVARIAQEVRDFITFSGDPQLNAWYAAYDHVRLMQLWGPMSARPEGVPMWTRDLKQEADRLGNPPVPEQDPATEHHALHDAQHDRDIDAFLVYYERENNEAMELLKLQNRR